MSATQEMLLGATALERDLDLEIERWVREIETREPQAYVRVLYLHLHASILRPSGTSSQASARSLRGEAHY